MKLLHIIIKIIDPAIVKLLAVLFICFSFLTIIILYSDNYIILGGEGNYFTDFNLVRKYGSFTWAPLMNGTGFPNPIINMLIPFFDILAYLQKIGISFKVLNILMVSFTYIFPFLSMLWLINRVLKLRFSVSFLISLFYIINPFSTYHLHGLMFWNSAPLFLLPLSFGIIYKYYEDKLKVFIFFGLVTSFFAFSLANIPYLAIFHVFLLLATIIIFSMREEVIRLKSIIRYFIIIELSFFLFNFWWLGNLIRFYLQDAGAFNFKNISLSWAKSYMVSEGGIMNYILSFRTLIEPGGYSFFSSFYYNSFVLIILIIPLALLVFLLVNAKRSKHKDKALLAIFSVLLLVIFFNKGAFPPFGNFYQFCITYVPLFEVFKTPLEKFSVLFVFLFSLNLALAMNKVKNTVYARLMAIYLLVCAIPYFTLNFIPDFKAGDNIYVSRKFINKKEYTDSENLLNSHLSNYRYLSLPGSNNYQVTIANHENKYYRGMDPIIYAINKGFVAAYSGNSDVIYDNLSEKNLENILSIYNIRKIMVNKDIYPSFGFKEKENVDKVNKILSQKMNKVENGSISIYSTEKFLPLIYVPERVIASKRDSSEISKILLRDDYDIRSGIFFPDQNNSELMRKMIDMSDLENSNDFSIEYKRINPIKYRIRVHKAESAFPLIFSETYHEGWKIYLTENKEFGNVAKSLDDYEIFPGNFDDQATKEDLVAYIKNKSVTTLGNRKRENSKENYAVGFVSKNFYGTIQNDNLPNGKFWETLFLEPVNEGKDHIMANGYANSWVIDPTSLCSGSKYCSKNPDGTYEMEFVVEFWPQRLFHGGILVTMTTILSSLGYMICKRKEK